MLRRYAIPCSLVVVIALGIAYAIYRLTPVNYTASCVFQISLPVTSVTAQSDIITFNRQLAGSEVALASRGDVVAAPAAAVGIDPGTLLSEVTVSRIEGTSDFSVSVNDPDARRAGEAANRLCDVYVQRITALDVGQQQAEISSLQAKISSLQQSIDNIDAIPPDQRSAGDQSFVTAEKQARDQDEHLLAVTLGLPADNISTLTLSTGGIRTDTRDLPRSLVVAAVGSVVAAFLIVLFGEVAREQGAKSVEPA